MNLPNVRLGASWDSFESFPLRDHCVIGIAGLRSL
jgi:hypothetical protein